MHDQLSYKVCGNELTIPQVCGLFWEGLKTYKVLREKSYYMFMKTVKSAHIVLVCGIYMLFVGTPSGQLRSFMDLNKNSQTVKEKNKFVKILFK